jgi:hypothetical protein
MTTDDDQAARLARLQSRRAASSPPRTPQGAPRTARPLPTTGRRRSPAAGSKILVTGASATAVLALMAVYGAHNKAVANGVSPDLSNVQSAQQALLQPTQQVPTQAPANVQTPTGQSATQAQLVPSTTPTVPQITQTTPPQIQVPQQQIQVQVPVATPAPRIIQQAPPPPVVVSRGSG